ncbi:MAG TPA: hypothetical protein ENJ09_05175, partial [Planctomycetes bacterium]|nr:hypothetical protein [Planctomycetota bacterium]
MEIEIRGNLVAGEEMPSVGGGRLAVRSALAPYRELASWPTSGPRDVEESLAVLRDPPRLEPVRRLAYAAGAAALRRAAGLERLRLRLGLDPEEAFALEPRLSWGERFAVRRGSEPARGVAVVATHWSSLLGEPLAQAARELASGRSVLLLSDPRVPRLAALVAEALIEVAPVGDSVGVLHGLSDEGVRALVRDPRVVRLVASGEPERVRDLRRWTEGRGGAGRI